MSKNNNDSYMSNNDPYMIAFREIIKGLISSWYVFLICIFASFLFGVHTLSNKPILYTATMQLMPRKAENINIKSSNLLSNLGIVQSSGASDFDIFLVKMASYETAQELDKNYNLMKKIFVKNWDEEKQEFFASEPGFSTINMIKKYINMPMTAKPDMSSLAGYLKSMIVVETGDYGETNVSVSATDPEFALWLLTKAYEVTNELSLKEQKKETSDSIEILSKKINTINQVQMKEVLTGMLVQKHADLMLVSMKKNLFTKIISKPTVEKLPSSPKIRLTLLISIFMGFVISFSVIILKMAFGFHFSFSRKTKKQTESKKNPKK